MLWQGVKGSAPFPLLSAKRGAPPHALLWLAGDNGVSPARFRARLGPRFLPLLEQKELGCRVRPLFPGGAEEAAGE